MAIGLGILVATMSDVVKHHPEPWRGEPMVQGCRMVTGMLLVGIVSICGLRTSPNDDGAKIILKEQRRGNRAKLMYKLESVATLHLCVYKY